METNNTVVVPNQYNGKNMFTIVKADHNGDALAFTKPVLNIGINKAKALIAHLEELKTYVEENS